MAASDDPRTKFGLSCPSGGDFQICVGSSTQFIGCCGVNACAGAFGGECPRSQLFDASFSASSGNDFLAQGCGADAPSSVSYGGEDRGGRGLWYTCSSNQPPFLGCCVNDPCNPKGCLDGNLVPAVLSGDSRNASQFELPMTTASTSSALPSTSSALPSTSSALLSTSSALPTATSTPGVAASGAKEDGDSTKLQIGPIVGIALAGVAVLLLVVGAYLWIRRREQNYTTLAREREQGLEDGSSKGTGGAKVFNEGMCEEA